MPGLWSTYKDIDPKAPKPVLDTIISTLVVSVEDRRVLIQALLTDVKNGRFPAQYSSRALLAAKTLARVKEGSEVLITEPNLRILYELGKSPQQDVSSEALRCVANAMLLIESGRDAWLAVGGGQLALDLLMDPKATSEFCFLASRILFLTTLKQNDFVKNTCEDLKVIQHLAARLDTLLASVIAAQSLAKEAMVDVLKFIFNLFLQYPRIVAANEGKGKAKAATKPKVIGEQWDEKFEPLIAPLIRIFNTLPIGSPPLVAPLTHVIHTLINIPITPYSAKWFSTVPQTSPPSLHTSTKSASEAFSKALSRLSSRRNSRPPSFTGSRSKSNSPPLTPPLPSGDSGAPTYAVVKRACGLVDAVLAHYFPEAIEVDDASIRDRCRQEGTTLDEMAPPLFALVVRFAEDEGARRVLRKWILPANLNREEPLEARKDTLGRCIRLMGSVYFPRLKDTVGEMLFAICNSDGTLLSTQIGYGNAAGYLFNKGILSAPPAATEEDDSSALGSNINPITGAKERKVEASLEEMTEEEKEREAEKLFVLFDRLEKTGIAQNPIRKAIQEGKVSMGPFGP